MSTSYSEYCSTVSNSGMISTVATPCLPVQGTSSPQATAVSGQQNNSSYWTGGGFRLRVAFDKCFFNYISHTLPQNFILYKYIVIGGPKAIFSAKFIGIFIMYLHAQFNVPRHNKSAYIK